MGKGCDHRWPRGSLSALSRGASCPGPQQLAQTRAVPTGRSPPLGGYRSFISSVPASAPPSSQQPITWRMHSARGAELPGGGREGCCALAPAASQEVSVPVGPFRPAFATPGAGRPAPGLGDPEPRSCGSGGAGRAAHPEAAGPRAVGRGRESPACGAPAGPGRAGGGAGRRARRRRLGRAGVARTLAISRCWERCYGASRTLGSSSLARGGGKAGAEEEASRRPPQPQTRGRRRRSARRRGHLGHRRPPRGSRQGSRGSRARGAPRHAPPRPLSPSFPPPRCQRPGCPAPPRPDLERQRRRRGWRRARGAGGGEDGPGARAGLQPPGREVELGGRAARPAGQHLPAAPDRAAGQR